jgi:hypothetical protein
MFCRSAQIAGVLLINLLLRVRACYWLPAVQAHSAVLSMPVSHSTFVVVWVLLCGWVVWSMLGCVMPCRGLLAHDGSLGTW